MESFPIKREFSLQWHITDKCEDSCVHCYLTQEKKRNCGRKEMPTEECFRTVDNFRSMLNDLNCQGAIYFTGGNPLLKKDIFDILEYAKREVGKIGILGNPTTITIQTLKKLKDLEICRYQLSLDGLRTTHDKRRKIGSFEKTIEALSKLTEAKISTAVMSTATLENMNELPEVMKVAAQNGTHIYSFARLVPIGEGANLIKEMPTPQQYKEFLSKMDETYQRVKKEFPRFVMAKKDPLWALYFFEKGELEPEKSRLVIGGCSVGINSLCLDVNGDVYNCRRLEETIGNVMQNSLKEIFLNSPILQTNRNIDKITDCNSCELLNHCRGCRAVAKAMNGSYFGKDPQCWKDN